MKRVSTFALALGLAVGAATTIAPAAHAQAEEQVAEFDAGNLSEGVRGPVAAAQEALQAEGPIDTAALRQQLESAQAAIQNDDDRFIVGQMLLQLGVKMQQAGAPEDQVAQVQQQGLRLALESDRVELERRGTYWTFIGNMANQAENYAEAVPAYQNAVRYDPNNGDAYIQLALALFNTGNPQAAYEAADNAIRIARQGGEVPRTWISVPLTNAYEAGDANRVLHYGQELVELHPTPENWNQALRVYQLVGQLDDQANLDLLRLMRKAGGLDQQAYREYVSLADQRGLPGEALAVYNEGVSASQMPAEQAVQSELQAEARNDEASLSDSISAAQSAGDGTIALNTADAYASYGQYDQAIDLYRLALQKGGVDAGTVNLRLGAALAAAGRTDEARQAFEAVTGSREGLADYWLVLVDQQAGGGAQTAAQPAAAEAETPAE